MSAAPVTSPDADLDELWTRRLEAIAAHVEDHAGVLPNQHAVDVAEKKLGLWWAELEQDSTRRGDVAALRRRAAQLRLDALATYVRAHDGRFPPNRSHDPGIVSLGCWWVAQNIELNQDRMDPWLVDQLAQLRELAAQQRADAKARRAAAVAVVARVRAQAATAAAGAAGAVAARRALKSPHLIPGDAEVLQARIDHPAMSLAQLAALLGLTPGQFSTKYYGALHRGPNSRTPLRKEFPDRLFAPGEAGDFVGVPRVTLARWANAGLIGVQRNRQGHRRYLGSELMRVKDLISEGWPAEFVEAAERGKR